jgi:hypothetical protein
MPQVAANCWSIAEAVGLDRPYRLHHLLDRACWDEDAALASPSSHDATSHHYLRLEY